MHALHDYDKSTELLNCLLVTNTYFLKKIVSTHLKPICLLRYILNNCRSNWLKVWFLKAGSSLYDVLLYRCTQPLPSSAWPDSTWPSHTTGSWPPCSPGRARQQQWYWSSMQSPVSVRRPEGDPVICNILTQRISFLLVMWVQSEIQNVTPNYNSDWLPVGVTCLSEQAVSIELC